MAHIFVYIVISNVTINGAEYLRQISHYPALGKPLFMSVNMLNVA